MSAPPAPLAGVRVLDLSRYIPGPCCSQLLADLGAEVVKLEQPPLGDPARTLPPQRGGQSTLHACLNRGKRSLLLDLRQPAGAALLRRLAARSDVLLEGFRPGVLARRGLGPEPLLRDNPRLVYCSLSGWGSRGPLASRPGHDVNYLARAGVLAGLRAGPEAPPPVPVAQLADSAAGLVAAVAVLAALQARERSGRGQLLEVSLYEAALWLGGSGLARLQDGGAPAPELSGSYACYNVYRCRDGRWLSVGALEPKFWAALCGVLGLEDALAQQWSRGDARRALLERCAAAFAERDRDEWLRRFQPVEACVEPVLEPDEALAEAGEELVDVACGEHALRLPGLPFRMSGHAPEPGAAPGPGQHTAAVLGELGLRSAEIEALRAAGVVA